jgi:hypothetical protein
MGYFPLLWLQQQLSVSGTTGYTCYRNLEQLLSFLNLPGSVLQCLPRSTMTVKHARSMRFCLEAAAIQAADDMLSHTPLLPSSGYGMQHWAAFLVTTIDSTDAPLLVRALRFNSADAIAKTVAKPQEIGAAPSETGTHRQLRNYGAFDEYPICVMTVSAAHNADGGDDSLPLDGRVWERVPWAESTHAANETSRAAVSATHPVFGAPLTDALLAATNSLSVAVGTLTLITGHYNGFESSVRPISASVWVLSW